MIAGASAAGLRVMTSSSSPGISLSRKVFLPWPPVNFPVSSSILCVVVRDWVISGLLRRLFPSYRGGGHGDYRTIVLAPATGQELADLTMAAFDLADKYRNPLWFLADGMMGQMMEPVIFKNQKFVYIIKSLCFRVQVRAKANLSAAFILILSTART